MSIECKGLLFVWLFNFPQHLQRIYSISKLFTVLFREFSMRTWISSTPSVSCLILEESQKVSLIQSMSGTLTEQVLNEGLRLEGTQYDTLWHLHAKRLELLCGCIIIEWMLCLASLQFYTYLGREIQLYFCDVYYCFRNVHIHNCFGWNRTYLLIVGMKLSCFWSYLNFCHREQPVI